MASTRRLIKIDPNCRNQVAAGQSYGSKSRNWRRMHHLSMSRVTNTYPSAFAITTRTNQKIGSLGDLQIHPKAKIIWEVMVRC